MKNSYIFSFKRPRKSTFSTRSFLLFSLIIGTLFFTCELINKNDIAQIMVPPPHNIYHQSSKTIPSQTMGIFIGDSHTRYGISRDLKNEQWKIFDTSGGLFIDFYYFLLGLEARSQLTNIDFITIPVCYRQFIFKEKTFISNLAASDRLRSHMDITEVGRITKIPFLHLRLKMWLSILNPRYGKESFFNRYIMPDGVKRTSRYWYLKRNDTAVERVYHHRTNGNIMDPACITYLNMIIQLAQRNNIKLYAIFFPHQTSYIEEMSKHLNAQLIDNLVESYITENKISLYLNYRSLYTERSSFFRDVDHLNRDGAKALTQKITMDISEFYNKRPVDGL